MKLNPKIQYDPALPALSEENRAFIPKQLLQYILDSSNIQTAYFFLRHNGYSHENARFRLNLFGINNKELEAVGIFEDKYATKAEKKDGPNYIKKYTEQGLDIVSDSGKTVSKFDLPKLRALIDARKSYTFIRSEFHRYSESQVKAAIKKVMSPNWKQPAYEDEKEDKYG